MATRRELIGQVIFLSSLRLKIGIRGSRFQITLSIWAIGSMLGFFVLGIMIAIVFLITPMANIKIPLRDFMVSVSLTVFTTFFVLLILGGATGTTNPFVNGSYDAHLLKRIPVDSSLLYLSARLGTFLRIGCFTLAVLLIFGPLMIVLQLPWWRFLGLVITFFLGFDLCMTSGYLTYFILHRFRVRGNWSQISNIVNPLILIPVLGVPVVAFAMARIGIFLEFATLSLFPFIPLINISVAFTGFLFRSGVPLESWIALIIVFVQVIVLNSLVLVLAVRSRPIEDIMEILPTLAFIDLRREDLIGGRTIESYELVEENILGERSFIQKPVWKVYLLKEWLAIKRIRALRKYLYSGPVMVGISIAILIFFPAITLFAIFLLFNFMAEFAQVCSQLEYKKPLERYPINRREIIKFKGLIIVLGSILLGLPLLIVKGLIALIPIVLVSIISMIISRTGLGSSKFITMIPAGIGCVFFIIL
ncbi:MAG: hypothetical protein ACFFC7_09930 [Candidatus Hermodarchaeota archaeon]